MQYAAGQVEFTLNHNGALSKLNVTLTQTESVVGVLGTFPRTGNPQVRLSAVSDLVAGEKRVGGEVIIFEHDGSPGPASTWRIFETGLFEIWISYQIGRGKDNLKTNFLALAELRMTL